MFLKFLLKPCFFLILVSALNGCFSSLNGRIKFGTNTVPDNSDLGKLIATKRKVTLASPSSVYLLVQSSITNSTLETSTILAAEPKNWDKGWELTFSSDISKIQNFEQQFNIFTPDDSKNPLSIELSYYNQDGVRVSQNKSFSNGEGSVTLLRDGIPIFLNIPDENFIDIHKLFAVIVFQLEGADCYAEIPPIYISYKQE